MARWQFQSLELELELELELKLKLELLGSAVSRWAVLGSMRFCADGRHSAELTAAYPMTSNVTVSQLNRLAGKLERCPSPSSHPPKTPRSNRRHPGTPRHPGTLAMPKDRGRSTSSGDKPAVIAGETSPQMRVGLQPKGGGGEEEPGRGPHRKFVHRPGTPTTMQVRVRP